ncbi:hypothetical protein ACHAWF_001945, partial [Thalassiosira exigua]
HDIATKAKRNQRVGGSRRLSNLRKAENEAERNIQDAAKPIALELSLSMAADALSLTAEARFDSVISQGGSSDGTKSGKKSATTSCQGLKSKKGGKKGSCPQGSALFFSGYAGAVGEEGEDALSPRTVDLTRSVLQASAGYTYMLVVDEEGSARASGNIIESFINYWGQFGVDRANLQGGVNKEKKVTNVIDEGRNNILAPKFKKLCNSGDDPGPLPRPPGPAYQDLPQRISLPDGEVAIDAAVGGEHTLILTESKKVYGCGLNLYGQLGLGNVTNTSTPEWIRLEDQVTGISAGESHSLINTKAGLYGMGSNARGRLCTVGGDMKTPALLNIGNVKSFSAGSSSSYILKDDGSITSCGANPYGQLGDNMTTDSTRTSVNLSGIASEVTDVYSGSFAVSAFIRTRDGGLHGMGNSIFGQLGVEDQENQKVPALVQFNATSPLEGHVSAGTYFTLFW